MAGHGQDLRQKPRYQLDPDEFESLTKQLVERFDAAMENAVQDGQTALCIALEGTDPLSDLCRHIEWRAFETLANNLPPETMRQEYGPYEDRSLFLLGVDLLEGTPIATLRIIVGIAGVGQPTKSVRDAVLHDGYSRHSDEIDLLETMQEAAEQWSAISAIAGSSGLPPSHHDRRAVEAAHGMSPGSLIFDIGTLGRLPGVGFKEAGFLWTPLLVAGALRLAGRLQVEHAVTFVTVDLLMALRKLCGAPWEPLDGFGEVVYVPGDTFMSQPCYLNLRELEVLFRLRRASGVRRPVPEARLDGFAYCDTTITAFAL